MLSRPRHWLPSVLARMPAAWRSCCALCGGAADTAVCAPCRAQYLGQHSRRCSQCGIPLSRAGAGDAKCGECLTHAPAFDATVVAVDYAPPVDQLVLALKFGARLELAPLMAHLLRAASRQAPQQPAQLTAVPLGAQRLTERGFNQALEIAKPLARMLGARLDARLAVRQRETGAQSLLHPDERQQNIRRAFVVPGDAIERLRGTHVGVVDDVMTTGATLNELAATLKRFGAARVTNFVFARTLPN